MEFRIDRGGFSPLGEVGRYSSSRTQKVSGGFRQSFDQIQFSGQPAGMQGRVRQLTAQISQQIRTRPTCHEIEALRQQVQDGLYSWTPVRSPPACCCRERTDIWWIFLNI